MVEYLGINNLKKEIAFPNTEEFVVWSAVTLSITFSITRPEVEGSPKNFNSLDSADSVLVGEPGFKVFALTPTEDAGILNNEPADELAGAPSCTDIGCGNAGMGAGPGDNAGVGTTLSTTPADSLLAMVGNLEGVKGPPPVPGCG